MAIFLMGFIVSAEATYCAEKTTNGAYCQNVPQAQCATGTSPITGLPYRCDRTSCLSTTYCNARDGTCLDTNTGECNPSAESRCDTSIGGQFFNQPPSEVARCDTGCCILGSQTTLTGRARCEALARQENITQDFRPNIQDDVSCRALASPETLGACVSETSSGRTCTLISRGQCQSSGGDFHAGLLCTAASLGTVCARTQRTTCLPDKNEVYFIDSCGNRANVYDANKVSDTDYWTYIAGAGTGVEVNQGNGKGNINSPTYGACEYAFGSRCGPESGSPKKATYGDYICRDLRCQASPITGGVIRGQGEEWCSQPISDFENAKPGDVSYLLYCMNGEVQYNLCDPYRYKLCQAATDANGAYTGSASCVINRGGDCLLQNTTADCLNTDVRVCKVLAGASFLRTAYGTERGMINSSDETRIMGSCVPKYPFGTKFWDPTGTMSQSSSTPASVCNVASVTCFVNYTQEILATTPWRQTPTDACVAGCMQTEGWDQAKCYQACTPVCLEDSGTTFGPTQDYRLDFQAKINSPWATGWQNLCTAIADCGVKANYLNQNGGKSWKDLFSGENIVWSTLPNAANTK